MMTTDWGNPDRLGEPWCQRPGWQRRIHEQKVGTMSSAGGTAWDEFDSGLVNLFIHLLYDLFWLRR